MLTFVKTTGMKLVAYILAALSITQADSLYHNGNLSKANEAALLTMVNAVEAQDTTTLIKALCLLTDIAVDRGEDTQATEYYNRCFELSGFGEPMFTLTSSLYNIANIYYQNGEYSKAKEYIDKSIIIDKNRATDSILALRYLLAARILYDCGDYTEALKYIIDGMLYSEGRNNNNVTGRFLFLKAQCEEAMQQDNPNWEKIEQNYLHAYEVITNKKPGFHYGAVNPYLGEILFHIGRIADVQSKDGKPYFREAINLAGTSQKMRGFNASTSRNAYRELARIYRNEGNLNEAQYCESKMESLSFVPYLSEMISKISLSQLEFIRREKEMEIAAEKNKVIMMLSLAIFLAVFASFLFFLYWRQFKQKKIIEERNAQLIKLDLQKDQLIEMLREERGQAADSPSMEAIVKDSVPLPDIKLSKREKEILEQCCKGLISKEIANNLNISTRTVEAHKLNIFHKVGVNTTNELIAFAFKSGIIRAS